MAPQKRKAESYDTSDPFVADDEDNVPAPLSKKSKGPTSNGNGQIPGMKTDDEGNNYWEISKARRVTISDFKGKKMVSIREYYEKDGKWLPGKKGITMTVEQYSAFLTVLPQIETRLSNSGETIPRPKYDGGFERHTSADEENDDNDSIPDKKANIEATSDEDED